MKRLCLREGIGGRVGILVSVVVVNFNSRELVSRAARAALSSTVSLEVIVVDNCSTDNSLRRLRLEHGADTRVRVIRNRRNLGFARACNEGIRVASGKYLLFLNPDCIIESDTIARMVSRLEQYPQAGMAGCTVRNPDGSEQAGSRRVVPTPWRSAVRVFHLDRLFPHHPRFNSFDRVHSPLPSQPVFVEAISGAFMLVRREALREVGPFDKRYFLHCEDLDWCMRFRRSGWQILFVPDVDVLHYKGACSADRPVTVLWHKHRGMMRFYRKFFRHQYPLPLMTLVAATVWARFLVLAGQELISRPMRKVSRTSDSAVGRSQVGAPPAAAPLSDRHEPPAVPGVTHRRVGDSAHRDGRNAVR